MKQANLDNFWGERSLIRGFELSQYLTKEIFTLKDTGFNLHIIRQWDKEHLLNIRHQAQKWRRFSFVDFIWLKVIEKLRAVGVPHHLIKLLKEGVFSEMPLIQVMDMLHQNPGLLQQMSADIPEREEFIKAIQSKSYITEEVAGLSMPFFMFILTDAVSTRVPVNLLLFEDGYWIAQSLNDTSGEAYFSELVKDERNRKLFKTYVSISLTTILKEFLSEDKYQVIIPELKILQENEAKILEYINSGKYESITVYFRNKKMSSLELVKEQDTRKKIVDILTENAYQNIVIKSHDGTITRIINTVKVQL